MSAQTKYDEYRSYEFIEKSLKQGRILWLSRPIRLWGPSEIDGHPEVISEERYLDVLIDKVDGYRLMRSEALNPDSWDELADRSHKIDWPCDVYGKQLPMVLDNVHKEIYNSGGSRAGKTHGGGSWFCNRLVEKGGANSQAWWVAPTRSLTQICVDKLVLGTSDGDRFTEAVIPAELIVSYPANENIADQHIYLVDGTRIALRHTAREGKTLIGRSPFAVYVDEAARIDHPIVRTILLNRVLDAKGQVCYGSTPVAEHWTNAIAENGVDYDDIPDVEGRGEEVNCARLFLTCFDNPWQSKKEIEKTIKNLGGPNEPAVQREVYGRIVPDGDLLWTTFQEDRNTFAGAGRDVEQYEHDNINKTALGRLLRRRAGNWRYVSGMDFNFWPMSILIAQVCVPQGKDPTDKRNWELWILDEVVRKTGNIWEFGKFLRDRAGSIRKDKDMYAGIPVICDATACQDNPPEGHKTKGMALSHAMIEMGFGAVPCRYGNGGKPENPSQIDSVSLCAGLFKEGRIKIHTERCPMLLNSITKQMRTTAGVAYKKSNTESDRLSGPVDALRYLVWAIFNTELHHPLKIRR